MPKDVSIPHAAQASVDMTTHSGIRRGGEEGCWGGVGAHQQKKPK